ncbi:MAG: DEAD/DEAH box helicase [Leptospiraceae bacterium]|nr:DEAD/DEAH box helicase [Leptospiraceae bacterium]MDW8305746.1 DEAD/DEAH box helicase [Leptospiraceae bacterium]
MDFASLALNPHLLQKLENKAIKTPTPIQEKTIPLALAKKDIIGCAKTGSGKTLAYLLPIIHHLLGDLPQIMENKDKGPLALILAPTRELVLQIQKEVLYLVEGTPLKCAALFGGVEHEPQKRELNKNPEIVVATPGRLLDFHNSKDISFDFVGYFVLDEADRMLDMGFLPDVKRILDAIPRQRQIQLFSATLDYQAVYSIWSYMRDPEEVLINPELIDHSKIEQKVIHLGKEEKLPYLIQYLENTNWEPVIIFTNTKSAVPLLVKNLNYHNIAAQGLSSLVNQKRRIRILEDFKNKKFRVLVATDVASRGLHIEDVQLVVNFDIPSEPETYVHRIGRTARSGKSGFALAICSELDYDHLSRLEKYLRYKIPVLHPEERYLENLSFVKIISPQAKPSRRVGEKKPKPKKTHRQIPKKYVATKSMPSHPIVARPLKKEKTFWQRIFHALLFWKRQKLPPMSEKTRALLEREAQLARQRRPNRLRKQKHERSHAGNRRRSKKG